MVFIYVIQLEDNKYYVGKTTNPYFRLNEHFNNGGSAWTKKYNPIKLLELIPDCDEYDEDKITLQYMNKYGIESVRGGSFTSIILDDDEINIITKMLDSSADRCFSCGESGHFVNECTFDSFEVCYRCGRNNHFMANCYATYHIDGYYLKK